MRSLSVSYNYWKRYSLQADLNQANPRAGVVVIPDYDIVPRIDTHVGEIQRIRCQASDTLGCPSIERTCCELLKSCGDQYGRHLNGPGADAKC